MKSTARLATVGGAALAATAMLAGPSLAATQHHPGRPAGEVFVQTDNTGGNAVVVYHRAQDGTLRQAGTYATGCLVRILPAPIATPPASERPSALSRSA